MNQYNTQNVKLSNSQLNKLKPGIKKRNWGQKKSLVSENADDEKNLHSDDHKFVFLINFLEIFSFLV